MKIGNVVAVSGTTAIDEDNNIIGKDNAYEQTVFILKKVEKALNQLGARLENVICTRIFVTNMENWEEIGKAHGEIFRQIKPAATMVEISKLIDPELMVEIEVDAIV